MRKKNIPNMPATRNSRATYDALRLRSAKSSSGVIGSDARRSSRTKSPIRTMPTANAAMVVGSPQPLLAARTNPYASEVTPTVEVRAPRMSKWPLRLGVSVNERRASATTSRPIGTLTNSTQRQDAT